MINKGIDKTVLKGFELELIDKKKLQNNDNVILQEKNLGIYVKDIDGTDISINYLKIIDDNMFNYLALGVKINKGVVISYSMIEISISELTDSNLKPLNVSEYRNMLKRIFRYIEDRYGLYMNLDKLYFDDIEMNVTSEMDMPFIEYEYLLSNMVYLVPRKYDISPHIGKDRTVKQYEFFNNTVHGKIYDKTRQLSEKFKIKLDKQYMRIEYTLHGSKKIEKALGTRYVNKMTDKAIYDYLKDMINKDLIKPIQKHIETSNKKLLNMAIELKEKDSRKWAKMFLYTAIAEKEDIRNGALPLVIDIDQIKEIIKKVSSLNNHTKTIGRLADEINRYPYLLDNTNKLNELIDKFIV